MAGPLEEYESAKEDFTSADVRYQHARKERTVAVNRLNDAQKKFDAWVNGVKSGAPQESDWKQRGV